MSGYLSPWYFQQFRDDRGLPLSNGYIETYVAESSIPKSLYYDIELENECPWPLPLDSAGYAPEFFLTSGSYTFAIYDRNDVQITRREPVIGAIAGGYGAFDTYKVMALSGDDAPDYLINKLQNSDSVTWSTSGNMVVATVTSAGSDTYQIKSTSADANPGYLTNKISNSSTINLTISGDKLKADYVGPNIVGITSDDTDPDFLGEKLTDTPTIEWQIAGYDGGGQLIGAHVTSAADTYKIKITSGDTPDYISNKIFGGTGIVVSQVEDEAGQKIYLSTTSNINSNGKVKITSAGELGYVADKIVAGTGIVLTTSSDKLTINRYTNKIVVNRDIDNMLVTTATAEVVVLSAVLSAGIWDVTGSCCGYIVPVNTEPNNIAGINVNILDTLSMSYDGWVSFAHLQNQNTARTITANISRRIFEVTTTKTIYLLAQCRFGLFSSCSFWGNIVAEKI